MTYNASWVQGESGLVTLDADELRKRIIVSLVSDDVMMERLVLKGGNAVDLVHDLAGRASLDLDFSLATDFPDASVAATEQTFRALLERGLGEAGYMVIDVELRPKPKFVTPDMAEFWGGYELNFKIISTEVFQQNAGDERRIRMFCEDAGPGHRKRFRVDFSKFEYCEGKQPTDIEGYRVWVYTPAMIVCEKLRAICQQMPEYRARVKSPAASPRARDFFDIHVLVEGASVDLSSPQTKALLVKMFAAKRVPLRLLHQIESHAEFHRDDFATVKDVVRPGLAIMGFDDYVAFVKKQVERLKPLGIE